MSTIKTLFVLLAVSYVYSTCEFADCAKCGSAACELCKGKSLDGDNKCLDTAAANCLIGNATGKCAYCDPAKVSEGAFTGFLADEYICKDLLASNTTPIDAACKVTVMSAADYTTATATSTTCSVCEGKKISASDLCDVADDANSWYIKASDAIVGCAKGYTLKSDSSACVAEKETAKNCAMFATGDEKCARCDVLNDAVPQEGSKEGEMICAPAADDDAAKAKTSAAIMTALIGSVSLMFL